LICAERWSDLHRPIRRSASVANRGALQGQSGLALPLFNCRGGAIFGRLRLIGPGRTDPRRRRGKCCS
jgi:hypothetical protein